MKLSGKCGLGILILVFIFSFLSLTALSPSKVVAANAAFDVKKMGDMSDFDPNHPAVTSGGHHQDRYSGFFFRSGGCGGRALLLLCRPVGGP